MKTLKYKNIAFILILFCLSLNGYSQNSADSLYNYLEIAAKNNSDVLQKFAEYQAALQKVPQVGSLPDPEFSMGIFL